MEHAVIAALARREGFTMRGAVQRKTLCILELFKLVRDLVLPFISSSLFSVIFLYFIHPYYLEILTYVWEIVLKG